MNENWLGYTDEEKEYGLLFSFKENTSDQHNAIQKGVELLKKNDLQQEMAHNRTRFLENKIDVTGLLVWFIENWPESKIIMMEDPDFQNRFLYRTSGSYPPS